MHSCRKLQRTHRKLQSWPISISGQSSAGIIGNTNVSLRRFKRELMNARRDKCTHTIERSKGGPGILKLESLQFPISTCPGFCLLEAHYSTSELHTTDKLSKDVHGLHYGCCQLVIVGLRSWKLSSDEAGLTMKHSASAR